MADATSQGEGSDEGTSEGEGSEEEMKRRFREALERKRTEQADANAARGGKDAGKVHGAHGPARSGVRFAARPAAERTGCRRSAPGRFSLYYTVYSISI